MAEVKKRRYAFTNISEKARELLEKAIERINIEKGLSLSMTDVASMAIEAGTEKVIEKMTKN